MRAMRWATAALGVVLVAQHGTARAQGSAALTPFVGATVYMNQPSAGVTVARRARSGEAITEARYQDAVAVGVFVGMHFDPRWELETGFAWAPSRIEARRGLGQDGASGAAYMYSAGVNFHLPEIDLVVPYLSAALGGETRVYGLSDVDPETHFMVALGGGLEFPVQERTVLRMDIRDCISWNASTLDTAPDALSHLMIVAGLSFAFPGR
jgi:hypothetical protein